VTVPAALRAYVETPDRFAPILRRLGFADVCPLRRLEDS
jgi:hypothetical protein